MGHSIRRARATVKEPGNMIDSSTNMSRILPDGAALDASSAVRRRELAAVLAFTLLLFAPWLGKAFHMDEAYFLACGRQILSDPWHPLAFSYNWYDRLVPMASINNTPPPGLYVLAAALGLSQGREWLMRLLLIPFDLLAAAGLYLLAARFLARPLLPVLIAIASPAYLIDFGLAAPEKFCAVFGLFGLYALVRGVDDHRRDWFWASAALLAAALVSKYAAALFLAPAAVYALRRGAPARRVAAYLAAALLPLAAVLACDWLRGGAAIVGSAWATTAWGASSWWSGWAHKLRALLAFTGGCGVVTAFWGLRRPGRGTLIPAVLALAAVVLLFSPARDAEPVRGLDRLTGMALSWGALLGCGAVLARGRSRAPGWALWAPWLLAAAALQGFVYWAVLARIAVFLTVPLTLALAESLEQRHGADRLGPFYAASLAATLAVSLPLALVDYRAAQAQKDFAAEAAQRWLPGRTVWFTGHWGLQYYLEKAGASALDQSPKGWSQVKPGDLIVAAAVNSNGPLPHVPATRLLAVRQAGSAVPLRLMSGWSSQAGFYSSARGFLPYALSAEPLERWEVREVLPPP